MNPALLDENSETILSVATEYGLIELQKQAEHSCIRALDLEELLCLFKNYGVEKLCFSEHENSILGFVLVQGFNPQELASFRAAIFLAAASCSEVLPQPCPEREAFQSLLRAGSLRGKAAGVSLSSWS